MGKCVCVNEIKVMEKFEFKAKAWIVKEHELCIHLLLFKTAKLAP